jgi:hypothetical protein
VNGLLAFYGRLIFATFVLFCGRIKKEQTMRPVLTLTLVAVLVSSLLAADQNAPVDGGMESLGRRLLDDLAPQVLQPPAGTVRPDGQSPDARFGDVGEDIGQPSGRQPLVRARQGMQQAESLLARRDADTGQDHVRQASAVQREVVEQLDKLIAELAKQSQGGNSQPSDASPEPNPSLQPKPGKSGDAAGRGPIAAGDSKTRLDRTSAQGVQKNGINDVVKNLWGHLPERNREQMMQSFSDEFLPKYELEIEQYYQRLSEEDNR